MDKKDITPLIEENLSRINIGDTFATQTKLYRTLGIPLDKKDGNKTIKEAVSMYFKWKLSNPETASKEIVITEINKSPNYIDGRATNGGAHNVKYGPIIKPALLRYKYPRFMTYGQIFQKIYDFPAWTFTPDSKTDAPHEQEYKGNLYTYLKPITDTALDGLQRENLITYKKVIVIYKGEDRGKITHITPDGSLLELCTQIYGESAASSLLDMLSCKLNQIVDELNIEKQAEDEEFYKPIEPFSLDSLTTAEFLERMSKNAFRDVIQESLCSPSTSDDYHIADSDQENMIGNIEEAICTQLNFTRDEMNRSTIKRQRVYRKSAIIYWLLGWNFVFKGLSIDVLPSGQACEEYSMDDFSHEKFLEALEPQIIHWVVDKNVYNPYEVEKKKRETGKKRVFEAHPIRIVATDEDIPYLARDKAVNRLHCRVFKRPIDATFFEKRLMEKETPSE